MPVQTYASTEIREQLARGPQPDEDFYRLNVSGNGRTNWVNVTPEQLERIAAVLEERPPASSDGWTFTGALLVRLHADDPDTARSLLQAAANAALEADPFIAAVEGTNVSPRPRAKARDRG